MDFVSSVYANLFNLLKRNDDGILLAILMSC